MGVAKSRFATVLSALLDRTDLFTRSEWSEFLKVTPAAISQWVNDKTVPSPELLRMIIGVLRESDGVPQELLLEFDHLARRPSKEISPHGDRLDRTLGDYLLRPLLKGFFGVYEPLPAELKEKVLQEASQMCRALKRARRAQGETRTKGFDHAVRVATPQEDTSRDVVGRISKVANQGAVYEFAGVK